MGFRLKITLKTEKKFMVLTGQPIAHWCEACGAESSFVDEKAEAFPLLALRVSERGHRVIMEGRSYLCLRSITDESR
jgi:hypothetical protein